MRRTLLLGLKIAVSMGLLYFALRKVDIGELLSRINIDSARWLVLAVVVALLQVLLGALRWREITVKCSAPLSLPQALRYNLVGTFFNQVLPSSIGGDAVRLWLLRNTGAGWRNAAYSVFIDRAIGLIALAVLVVASLPWSYQLITDSRGRLALAAIDLIALGGGLGFLILGHLPWPVLRRWWLTHHPYNCSVIAWRALVDRNSGLKISVLSLMVHVLTAVMGWCVARSINAPVEPFQIFLVLPPVILITMLPIAIAGWGVRETAMMVAFSYAHLPEQDGINVSLLFGAVTFTVGLMGGLVWILSAEKKLHQAAAGQSSKAPG